MRKFSLSSTYANGSGRANVIKSDVNVYCQCGRLFSELNALLMSAPCAANRLSGESNM